MESQCDHLASGSVHTRKSFKIQTIINCCSSILKVNFQKRINYYNVLVLCISTKFFIIIIVVVIKRKIEGAVG